VQITPVTAVFSPESIKRAGMGFCGHYHTTRLSVVPGTPQVLTVCGMSHVRGVHTDERMYIQPLPFLVMEIQVTSSLCATASPVTKDMTSGFPCDAKMQ
jgi:hypothetical protein